MWEAHNWTKRARLLLGALTAVPVVVGIAAAMRTLARPTVGLTTGGEGFCVLCVAHIFMVFMLLLAYIPASYNNQRLSRSVRRLWMAGFILAGIVTMPAYWYRHIWNAPYHPDEGRLAPS